MKVMNYRVSKLVLPIFGVVLLAVLVLSRNSWTESLAINSFVAEKYLGKYDELEKNGYTTESGIGSNFQRIPQALALSVCRPPKEGSQLDCVFILTEIKGRDTLGHAIRATPSDMIHIRLPKEWGYFDSVDTECKATEYPKADIVAIGQWTWRNKPLLGGYAHSFKKAWRIDYRAMRFIEITTHGVECGFDDDRD